AKLEISFTPYLAGFGVTFHLFQRPYPWTQAVGSPSLPQFAHWIPNGPDQLCPRRTYSSPHIELQTDLNRTRRHWYSTGSGSDRAPHRHWYSTGSGSDRAPHRHWYSTGSGSDRAPHRNAHSARRPVATAPGTVPAACTNVAWFDLDSCRI